MAKIAPSVGALLRTRVPKLAWRPLEVTLETGSGEAGSQLRKITQQTEQLQTLGISDGKNKFQHGDATQWGQ